MVDVRDGTVSRAVAGNLLEGEYEGDDIIATILAGNLLKSRFDVEQIAERIVPPRFCRPLWIGAKITCSTISLENRCLLIW